MQKIGPLEMNPMVHHFMATTTSAPQEDAAAVQSKTEGRLRRRLVLLAVPYQGHLNPMIQLANLLDSKGFTIIFILTQSTPLDFSKYPNIQFRQIPDGMPEIKAGGGGAAAAKDVTSILTQLNINLIDPLRECLAELLTEEESIACLISDVNWYFTQQVADDLKLPRIVFRTAGVSAFLALDYLPVFQQKGYLSGQDYKPEDEVEEFPPLKVKDIPMVPKTDPEVFQKYIEKMLRSCKESSGLIFNSFKELEGNELSKISDSFGVTTFSIGPLHKYFSASSSSLLKQDRSAISWLDTQAPKSVIYVSFGSIAEMEKTHLNELAWGLINSNQPFLLVIRHNSNWVHDLPDGFLEVVEKRGYIVNWAPQQEVLAHPSVGVFWTHSGWNSITESLCEGVPMICSPFFADQMVNSRFVNDVWKVGLRLEKGFDRVEIEGAIRKLMVEKENGEIKSRVIALKEQIDSCVQEGGSSFQSLQSFIDYILSLNYDHND